jgi:hypothetical protein
MGGLIHEDKEKQLPSSRSRSRLRQVIYVNVSLEIWDISVSLINANAYEKRVLVPAELAK